MANLQDANFARADVRDADFRGAYLNEALGLYRSTSNGNTIYDQWTVFPTNANPDDFGWTFVPTAVGDLNLDGVLSADDIDLLAERLRERTSPLPTWIPDEAFDMDGDGRVNVQDYAAWASQLKGVWLGDANLDGEFDTSDFVHLFQRGHYEDTVFRNSGWADGDFNADGEFDSRDLVTVFQAGGYNTGPLPANTATLVAQPWHQGATAAVPEANSFAALFLGLITLAIGRRSR